MTENVIKVGSKYTDWKKKQKKHAKLEMQHWMMKNSISNGIWIIKGRL